MTEIDISTIIQRIAIVYPTLLFALVFHEYAHAWVARRFGDDTSEWSGRLTLNPAAHIDPLGTVVLPLICLAFNSGFFFGWARPVPIDSRKFSNFRSGLFWVAFAGPLANILLGVITAFVYVGFMKWVPPTFSLFEAIQNMLFYLVGVNFVLAFFNLIPFPPLDGANMVLSRLSYNSARKFEALQAYSLPIFLLLMWTGALRVVVWPVMICTNLSLVLASHLLGMPVAGL